MDRGHLEIINFFGYQELQALLDDFVRTNVVLLLKTKDLEDPFTKPLDEYQATLKLIVPAVKRLVLLSHLYEAD